MNKVILKGRLTADPTLRRTPNDVSVSTFTVAVNRRFDKEKTDFITCEAWQRTAEFVTKYFSRGKEIALVGELHIDKVEKDGDTRYYTKVIVDEVEFCGSKAESAEPAQTDTPNYQDLDDDDSLPF